MTGTISHFLETESPSPSSSNVCIRLKGCSELFALKRLTDLKSHDYNRNESRFLYFFLIKKKNLILTLVKDEIIPNQRKKSNMDRHVKFKV